MDFLAELEKHRKSDALKSFREKGWNRLSALGLPTKSHEAFRYVPLKDLYQSTFEAPASLADPALPLLECKHSHLVFVDGKFSAEHSDVSALPVTLLSLNEALRTRGSFLQQHFERSLKEENDPFALANLSVHSEGAFFYLPPDLDVSTPVQVIHLFTGAFLSAPRLHIVVGARSRLNLIETSQGNHDVAHFFLPVTDISLDEGASFDLINAIDCPKNGWQMQSLRASLKKEARLSSLHVTTGAKAVRHNYRVQLKGENSEANLSGLWMLEQNHTAHTHATIEHEAPNTRSMQLFKGVLSDHSQSSFEGKILVRPEAQKTEAYQLNKNLILNAGAVANSKPNLEIFADDVKASHGATVSQLDQDQLFYLSTRRIALPQAKQLLVEGFCRELIDKIPYDSIKERLW